MNFQKETLRLNRNHGDRKGFRSFIAGMFRSIADSIENRNKNDDIQWMANVDDQRAHHFGPPEDLDDSA